MRSGSLYNLPWNRLAGEPFSFGFLLVLVWFPLFGPASHCVLCMVISLFPYWTLFTTSPYIVECQLRPVCCPLDSESKNIYYNHFSHFSLGMSCRCERDLLPRRPQVLFSWAREGFCKDTIAVREHRVINSDARTRTQNHDIQPKKVTRLPRYGHNCT